MELLLQMEVPRKPPSQKRATVKPIKHEAVIVISPDTKEKVRKRTASAERQQLKAACGLNIKLPKEKIEDIDAADVYNELANVEYAEDIYKFYKEAEDPEEADKLLKIQRELDETKFFLVSNVLTFAKYLEDTDLKLPGSGYYDTPNLLGTRKLTEFMNVGEKLDSSVEKSSDLSATSQATTAPSSNSFLLHWLPACYSLAMAASAVSSTTHNRFCFSFLLLILSLLLGLNYSAQLSEDFYSKTCPNALSIIKTAVANAVELEARMGASLLRLHFHDCFVNGCDASILLDDTANFTGEQSAGPNLSIRGLDVIDNIKIELEKSCPNIVSCADIVAVAARDSVLALDGPSWSVLLGRRDSTTASLSAAISNLPGGGFSLSELISSFSNKGFSAREMVALSGSHTIGQARCTSFRDRIYNDKNINASFAASLQFNYCPQSGGDSNLAPLDTATSILFDNVYFKNLQSQKGLLHSDQELFNGGSTDSIVSIYSSNPSTFATDFANAMVKMGNLSPLTGTSGEIRTNCRKIN
nr:cationic peroxidase 1-like [Ipomoea trifida]